MIISICRIHYLANKPIWLFCLFSYWYMCSPWRTPTTQKVFIMILKSIYYIESRLIDRHVLNTNKGCVSPWKWKGINLFIKDNSFFQTPEDRVKVESFTSVLLKLLPLGGMCQWLPIIPLMLQYTENRWIHISEDGITQIFSFC